MVFAAVEAECVLVCCLMQWRIRMRHRTYADSGINLVRISHPALHT